MLESSLQHAVETGPNLVAICQIYDKETLVKNPLTTFTNLQSPDLSH